VAPLFLFSLASFLSQQFHEHKALIVLVVTGMIAGLLAQMILPGRGFGMVTTIIIGVAGAWLGNRFLKVHLVFITDPIIKEVAAAVVCAMFLALIVNILRGGNDRDKTHWRHN